ncbi:hypothetical protein GCM10027035_33610 [Emticicia sediminis]
MRIFTTLLLLTCSIFAFGNDNTFTISAIGPTTICSSDSVNIVATGCSGNIIWNNGNTYNPSAIHAVQAGNYFATCLPTGEVSNTITVTILPPTAPIITQNANTLIANGCEGTVIWNNGTEGTSITVMADGSYNAYCQGSPCRSTVSNTIQVNVLPKPLITTDKTSLCNGERAVLTATNCTGIITWSNGFTGSTISVNAATTYYAFCTKDDNRSLNSDTLVISAISTNPAVISALNGEFCLNPTVILISSACVDGTLLWSNGSTGTSLVVSTTGTYSVQCQNSCGTSPPSNIITISQSGATPTTPLVSSNQNTICNGSSAILTASLCNGTVLWNTGATTSIITVTQTGTYLAICQTSCGSSNTSNTWTIQQGFPPAAPVISANKNVLCDGESATLSATGCSGQVVWSTGVTTTSIQLIVSGTYTATCRNQCGESGPSNSIVLRSGILPTIPTAISNKASICSGETANLVVSGCNGVVIWSNGMTPTSVQISQPGTYTVTCNTICGSAVSNNVVIVATNISQAPSITSTKTALCGAENSILTATGCSGTVLWNNGSTGTTITVSKEGSYTARCQISCGISSDSNSIKIVQLNNQCTPITIRKLR